MRKALVFQCFSIRPVCVEPPTLGLEIPCSIQLSYGREGGFCVSGPPLLDDLLGAGRGNPLCAIAGDPAALGRILRGLQDARLVGNEKGVRNLFRAQKKVPDTFLAELFHSLLAVG